MGKTSIKIVNKRKKRTLKNNKRQTKKNIYKGGVKWRNIRESYIKPIYRKFRIMKSSNATTDLRLLKYFDRVIYNALFDLIIELDSPKKRAFNMNTFNNLLLILLNKKDFLNKTPLITSKKENKLKIEFMKRYLNLIYPDDIDNHKKNINELRELQKTHPRNIMIIDIDGNTKLVNVNESTKKNILCFFNNFTVVEEQNGKILRNCEPEASQENVDEAEDLEEDPEEDPEDPEDLEDLELMENIAAARKAAAAEIAEAEERSRAEAEERAEEDEEAEAKPIVRREPPPVLPKPSRFTQRQAFWRNKSLIKEKNGGGKLRKTKNNKMKTKSKKMKSKKNKTKLIQNQYIHHH
jgi:hypothetical protein